jgi:hypothetical protein
MENHSDNVSDFFQHGIATVEPSAIEGGNVALDIDTQTGLLSHPAKRVKMDEFSPEEEDEEPPEGEAKDDDSEGSSESGSENSFFLDLFHAGEAGFASGETRLTMLICRRYKDFEGGV